jgi:hypothetical protein
MYLKQSEVAEKVRPLRLTIERSLTYEGEYTAPAAVTLGSLTLTASVMVRRGRFPFQIWYRAQRDGKTVIEVASSPEFVRLVQRALIGY